MKRTIRSICLALAMSVGWAVGWAVGVVSYVTAPIMRFVSSVCRDMACGVEKLKRELAYQFTDRSQVGTAAGAGLRRESNGYRQTSAEEYEGFAPAI